MVYTANWVIIYYLPPFTGTWKLHWWSGKLQKKIAEVHRPTKRKFPPSTGLIIYDTNPSNAVWGGKPRTSHTLDPRKMGTWPGSNVDIAVAGKWGPRIEPMYLEEILHLFTGFYTSQVVIAGFLNHQQYISLTRAQSNDPWSDETTKSPLRVVTVAAARCFGQRGITGLAITLPILIVPKDQRFGPSKGWVNEPCMTVRGVFVDP